MSDDSVANDDSRQELDEKIKTVFQAAIDDVSQLLARYREAEIGIHIEVLGHAPSVARVTSDGNDEGGVEDWHRQRYHPIGSLTKLLVASAIASALFLGEDFPDQGPDPELDRNLRHEWEDAPAHATWVKLLCHTALFDAANTDAIGPEGEDMLSEEDMEAIAPFLVSGADERSWISYNNLHYALASLLTRKARRSLDEQSGIDTDTTSDVWLLNKYLRDVAGMEDFLIGEENLKVLPAFSKPTSYAVLSPASAEAIQPTHLLTGSILNLAMGIFCTIADVARWCRWLLDGKGLTTSPQIDMAFQEQLLQPRYKVTDGFYSLVGFCMHLDNIRPNTQSLNRILDPTTTVLLTKPDIEGRQPLMHWAAGQVTGGSAVMCFIERYDLFLITTYNTSGPADMAELAMRCALERIFNGQASSALLQFPSIEGKYFEMLRRIESESKRTATEAQQLEFPGEYECSELRERLLVRLDGPILKMRIQRGHGADRRISSDIVLVPLNRNGFFKLGFSGITGDNFSIEKFYHWHDIKVQRKDGQDEPVNMTRNDKQFVYKRQTTGRAMSYATSLPRTPGRSRPSWYASVCSCLACNDRS